jgi:tRNA G26 N,N-dimethylase Trm1
MQVEVFKTSVDNKQQAKSLIEEMSQDFPGIKVNFDLEDCAKILRIEATNIQPPVIVEILKRKGFECEVLN